MVLYPINEKLEKKPLILITDIDLETGNTRRRCKCRERRAAVLRAFVSVLVLVMLASLFLGVVNRPWCQSMAPSDTSNAAQNQPQKMYQMLQQGLPDAHGVRESRVVEFHLDGRD